MIPLQFSDRDSQDPTELTPTVVEESLSTSLPYVNPFSIRTFEQLRTTYGLLFQPTKLRHWRLLYPNRGQLDGFEHFGTVLILATDGIEALFHVDESGQLWKGHLAAFNGPVAKEFVDDDDWDFENRKRRVRVFKRADGSMVIIPQDSMMEAYWSKHQRMSKEEQQVWEAAGHGDIDFSAVDDAIEQLRQHAAGVRIGGRKTKSKRQQILDNL